MVDTSVWSLAFRKKSLTQDEIEIVSELKELIIEKRVIMIGPIKQELLSGISDNKVYNKLKDKIAAFEDKIIESEDYIMGAEVYNSCRRSGVQGSHIDFLIVAFAKRRHLSVFTTDNDFKNFSKIIDYKLHLIRENLKQN